MNNYFKVLRKARQTQQHNLPETVILKRKIVCLGWGLNPGPSATCTCTCAIYYKTLHCYTLYSVHICIYIHASKNISIKMLKDVGITVPKVEKQVQYEMKGGVMHVYCCMPSSPVLMHTILHLFLYFLALSSLQPSTF